MKFPSRRVLAALENCTLLVPEEAVKGESQGGSREVRRERLLLWVETRRNRIPPPRRAGKRRAVEAFGKTTKKAQKEFEPPPNPREHRC